ncbi:MAG: CvpA family protein [Planctomycetia bacterium]|nr:CvpA family protein [Planctomycetia bacterium]
METYDWIMLGVLGLAIVLGAWRGLAWQLASLASLVLSYFLALRYSEAVAAHISAAPPLNRVLAMVAIYAVSSLAIWLGFQLVSGMINRVRLQEWDRQMGALLGGAKGVLWCVVITFFVASVASEPTRKSILSSKSGQCIGYVVDRVPALLPKEVREPLDPYIKKLDEQLQHEHVDRSQPSDAPAPGNPPANSPVPSAIP